MTTSDFLSSQLQPMGLNPAEHASEAVNLPAGKEVVWGDDPDTAPFPVHVVTTASLDTVRDWIGPEGDGERAVDKAMFAAMPADSTDEIGLAAAARHYVYGAPGDVAHLRGAIEKTLGPFTVMVAAPKTITIPAGTVLTYDGSVPKVVVANELIFGGAGAQIRSLVHLTMKVDSVTIK